MMRDLELFELQSDEGPCLDTFSTGEPVVNVDLHEAEERWPTFTEAALAADMRSTHAVPLRLRGQLIGAMNLFSSGDQRLTDDDLSLGQALADVATIGLLQQRAIQEQAILAHQLQTALDTRILVEQAKGVLAERTGLTPNETFGYLRKHARATRQTLQVVALEVIEGRLDFGRLSSNR
jgi:GAF domain-containing protein